MSISFTNISKAFGNDKAVLKNLSFNLPEGQFSALLGPSGCGKTTLLRLIAGLDMPTTGSIAINSEELVNCESKYFIDPEKRNIGMVFQSYAVWPHLNVFENVAFPLRVRKTEKSELESKVIDVLKMVRLDGLEKRLPNALSGGQQQRVALARALVQRPRLLLLDEPLSNLDASLRASMRTEIKQLQEKFKLTAIIVTHDWSDAKALCENIVVLNDGNIVQQGSPQQLVAQPASPFVAQVIKGDA